MLVRITRAPDEIGRTVIPLNNCGAQTLQWRAVHSLHRRAKDVSIRSQYLRRREDSYVVAAVVRLGRRVQAERRVCVEAAVCGNARIAIPECLARIPGDVTTCEDRAVVHPMIEVLRTECVVGVHALEEGVIALELDGERVLRREKIE